ncbi:MAG: radical SAM protein [Candidatus ainarchaeum sp.]|nr:radical SAM protein [Candidatus ainarchaeum sp.]
MKILLIYAKSSLEISDHTQAPLGICYLASYIRQKSKHIVELLDDTIESKTLDKVVKEFKPELIGISFSALSAKRAYNIAKKFKGRAIFVAGGPYATFCPEEVLNKGFDFVVYGEGEKTFLQLVNKLEDKKSLKNQKGIVYKKGGKIIKNIPQPLIKNLDSLPTPARDLLKKNKYMQGAIMTSRGCPFNCLFCNSRKFWQQTYRSMSVSKIYKELEELVNKYKYKHIFFNDDTFTINQNKVIGLCKLIIKKNLKFTWAALSRADTLSEERISWMKKAGCNLIFIGVESGSEKILKTINKNISLEQIKYAVQLCKKHNITCRTSFILGLPGDYSEQLKSLDLMEEITPDSINIHLLAIFPGSEIYENMGKYGITFKKLKNWQDYCAYYSLKLFKIINFNYLSKKQAITLCKIFIKRLKKIGYTHRGMDSYKKGRTIKTFLD